MQIRQAGPAAYDNQLTFHPYSPQREGKVGSINKANHMKQKIS